MSDTDLIYVRPDEVLFIVKRDRQSNPQERELYQQVKESIRTMGQRVPLKVESITHWPVERRRRPDNGTYKWRALYGQGRCEIAMELARETKDDSYLRVPAQLIEKADASTIASAFLTENLLRNPLSWSEQAHLMKSDIEALPGGPTKENIRQLATAYFVTPAHVTKMLRILQKLNPALEKELKGLTIEQAETLTAIPQPEQSIVMETISEEGLPKRELAAVARLARKTVEEGAPLSKTALRGSLARLRADLAAQRNVSKSLSLAMSNGPDNLRVLLADKKWRRDLEREGIDFGKFEGVTK